MVTKRLMKLFEKMIGKTMLWAGIEIGKKGQPAWQLRVIAGIERDKPDEKEDKQSQ